jgi:predicted esterase
VRTDKAPLTRRQFVLDTTLALATWRSAPTILNTLRRYGPADGRLAARPSATPHEALSPGLHTLSAAAGGARPTVAVIPPGLSPDRPAPFVLMLHGATESSEQSLSAMQAIAEHSGAILLAPSSAGTTWDAIRGFYGDDLSDIDQQLTRLFERCLVDPHHIAVAGFSDGASYAVSLGLINGDLFTHIMAYSPGFIIPGMRHGQPRVFIAHGTHDHILPIDRCGRRIANELDAAGYAVDFNEFDGDHMIRPEMVDRSMTWFTGRPS